MLPSPNSAEISLAPSLWLGRKLSLVTSAWATLAPDIKFAEMSLGEFLEATSPSIQNRETLATLAAKVKSGIAERAIADKATRLLIQRVVAGVICDAAHGPDSPLYRAMGFVRASERATGATPEGTASKTPRIGLMERLAKVTSAWKEFAPDTTFAGMSLDQFTAAAAPSTQARARLAAARANQEGAIATKDDADAVSVDLIKRVVSGVKAARNFGDNSPLYRAMGYRLASERRPYKRRIARIPSAASPAETPQQIQARDEASAPPDVTPPAPTAAQSMAAATANPPAGARCRPSSYSSLAPAAAMCPASVVTKVFRSVIGDNVENTPVRAALLGEARTDSQKRD